MEVRLSNMVAAKGTINLYVLSSNKYLIFHIE